MIDVVHASVVYALRDGNGFRSYARSPCFPSLKTVGRVETADSIPLHRNS